MVTIFISDVHGCILELEKLLHKLEPYKKKKIIFLGDLIGKGPAENEVVKLIRSEGHVSLMGNHELACIKYKNLHYNNSKNGNKKWLTPNNFKYIKKMPTYILCKKFLAVHAGINPLITKNTNNHRGKQNAENKNNAIKNTNENASSLKNSTLEKHLQSLHEILKKSSVATLTSIRTIYEKPWHAYYNFSIPLVYGHWGNQGLHFTQNTIGLDSGCVYGGKLSAYILEEKRIVQVQAKKVYA